MNVMLDEGAYMPERAHPEDAGADLKTPVRFCLRAGSRKIIDTGVHVQIPKGYGGFVKSKSGLMCYSGVLTDGLIDCEYTGSIRVCLFNHSKSHLEFKAGDKIAQLVIVPIDTPEFVQVESFEKTERGNNGFGSTGR